MVNKKLIGGLILAFVISTVVASAMYFCLLSWRQSRKKRKKDQENSTIHLTRKSPNSELSAKKQAEPNQQFIAHENDVVSQDFVDSEISQHTIESGEREQQKQRNQIQHSVRFTISSDQTNSK